MLYIGPYWNTTRKNSNNHNNDEKKSHFIHDIAALLLRHSFLKRSEFVKWPSWLDSKQKYSRQCICHNLKIVHAIIIIAMEIGPVAFKTVDYARSLLCVSACRLLTSMVVMWKSHVELPESPLIQSNLYSVVTHGKWRSDDL